jgi:hypothetical protein
MENPDKEKILRIGGFSSPQAVGVAYTGPVEGRMVGVADLPNETPHRELAPLADRG